MIEKPFQPQRQRVNLSSILSAENTGHRLPIHGCPGSLQLRDHTGCDPTTID